jgi:thiamine-phosphate pyrophosphorylase
MQLVVITWPDPIAEEHATLKALFHEGLEVLHVRKPEWTIDALRNYLHPLLPDFANRLVLHNHYELAVELGLRGIHITEKQKHLEPAPQSATCVVSGSIHSTEQVSSLPDDWAYAFLSPIFPSLSKPGYEGSFSEEALKIANAKTSVPLFALGGITNNTLHMAGALNFSGAATLGHIWQPTDPHKRVANFLQLQKTAHAYTS